MNEYAWLCKRVGVTAILVGMFWNDGPRSERAAVYLVALGVVLLVGWLREIRRDRRSAVA